MLLLDSTTSRWDFVTGTLNLSRSLALSSLQRTTIGGLFDGEMGERRMLLICKLLTMRACRSVGEQSKLKSANMNTNWIIIWR